MGSSWIAGWHAWWNTLRSRFGGGALREQIDPDVRDVFIAELDEVAETLAGLLPAWRGNRGDTQTLQAIRRGFHTIKGSGQMVGANTLGRFCGRIERLALNLIERRAKASPEVIAAMEEAIALLPACAAAVRDDRPLPSALLGLSERAQQLRGPG
jgi:chemosensory pili system protein ChpA (sensor histidine kinase/response regulator)